MAQGACEVAHGVATMRSNSSCVDRSDGPYQMMSRPLTGGSTHGGRPRAVVLRDPVRIVRQRGEAHPPTMSHNAPSKGSRRRTSSDASRASWHGRPHLEAAAPRAGPAASFATSSAVLPTPSRDFGPVGTVPDGFTGGRHVR